MRSKLWIIDGFNLIRGDARLSGEERARGAEVAKAMLEAQLAVFLASQPRATSIVLCYDGARLGVGTRSRAGMRILHPPPGASADDLVLEQARASEGNGQVIVVTSDRADIGRRLHGLRVERRGAREFGALLWGAGERDGSADPGAEKPRGASHAENRFWLEQFEKGSDDRTPD